MSFKEKALQNQPKSGLKQFMDFNGSWEDYKVYLSANGALSPNLNAVPGRKKLNEPKGVRPNAVPWFGKTWDKLTDSDKKALAAHLAKMDPKKGLEYCKYLKSYCGYPDLKSYIVEA